MHRWAIIFYGRNRTERNEIEKWNLKSYVIRRNTRGYIIQRAYFRHVKAPVNGTSILRLLSGHS